MGPTASGDRSPQARRAGLRLPRAPHGLAPSPPTWELKTWALSARRHKAGPALPLLPLLLRVTRLTIQQVPKAPAAAYLTRTTPPLGQSSHVLLGTCRHEPRQPSWLRLSERRPRPRASFCHSAQAALSRGGRIHLPDCLHSALHTLKSGSSHTTKQSRGSRRSNVVYAVQRNPTDTVGAQRLVNQLFLQHLQPVPERLHRHHLA